MTENKIHVAYGFHVNCYHSYRGDTNDNLGFGSDIRIIRKILDVLTEFNEKDLKSPVMTGISGNLFNYITKGAKAIGHIIFTQIKSKK